jgi:hypothetical protein
MRRTAICWLVMVLFAVVFGFCQVTTTKRAENPGFPRVVARIRRWHQTGAISATTLFTPQHFGVYRVSGVAVKTSGNDGDYVSVCIAWIDGAGTQQQCVQRNSVGDLQVGPIVLRDVKGSPIIFFTSTYGTLEYNLFLVVEQIM